MTARGNMTAGRSCDPVVRTKALAVLFALITPAIRIRNFPAMTRMPVPRLAWSGVHALASKSSVRAASSGGYGRMSLVWLRSAVRASLALPDGLKAPFQANDANGGAIGISLASLRRIWAAAARWNRSRAPQGFRGRSLSRRGCACVVRIAPPHSSVHARRAPGPTFRQSCVPGRGHPCTSAELPPPLAANERQRREE